MTAISSGNNTREYRSYWVIPVYILLCLSLFPWFKYIIDPDDTAYLRIAERWAAGDVHHAVNGMWSPLNAWIATPFLCLGAKAIYLFKYLNIGFGVILLAGMRRLMQKAGFTNQLLLPALAGLLPFALYATYHELAADWLQCTILILYLNLVFSERYTRHFIYPVACAVLGVLAFYAKYYNFHFFWLHFIAVNIYLFRARDKRFSFRFFQYIFTGIVILLLGALPWILLLHHKYGFWKLNYSGAIDLSWSLDNKTIRTPANPLLPPTEPGAASWWEDPFPLQHRYVTPFSSGRLLVRQLLISVKSVFTFILSLESGSLLLIIIWTLAIRQVLRDRWRNKFVALSVLTFITLPLGYFLFHIEARFIWPLILLGYLLGILYVNAYFKERNLPEISRKYLFAAIYALTFMAFPVYNIIKCFGRDEDVAVWAESLRPLHLRGSFIANADENKMMRLAYETGMSVYIPGIPTEPEALVVNTAVKDSVCYYIELKNAGVQYNSLHIYPEITKDSLPYFKVYRLR